MASNDPPQISSSLEAAPRCGRPTRQFVNHNYRDHCSCQLNWANDAILNGEPVNRTQSIANNGRRRGVAVPFPVFLHTMLRRAESDRFDHIVSWQPHGRSFKVHRPQEFVNQVMPRWFKQRKLTSFQRQLNLYGFVRLTTGPDRGGYYHEMFLRCHLELSELMVRTRIKGTGVKPSSSPLSEPNFYVMAWCSDDRSLVRSEENSIDTFESFVVGDGNLNMSLAQQEEKFCMEVLRAEGGGSDELSRETICLHCQWCSHSVNDLWAEVVDACTCAFPTCRSLSPTLDHLDASYLVTVDGQSDDQLFQSVDPDTFEW